jgi:hypothetical protein
MGWGMMQFSGVGLSQPELTGPNRIVLAGAGSAGGFSLWASKAARGEAGEPNRRAAPLGRQGYRI